MSGRLGLAITPGELQRLTDGAADPVGNLRTGLGQAAEQSTQGVRQVLKGLSEIPRLRIRKDVMMAPMFMPPDLEQEYLDEINKKKLML